MVTFGNARRVFLAVAAILAAAIANAVVATHAVAQAGAIVLAPHRAVYDLKLAESRGKSTLASARGRILYDFGGSACEGYTLQFRQVSELNNGEGRVSTSDLRSSTFEEGDAKSFRFNSQNSVNNRVIDVVDGRAHRSVGATSVQLTKPENSKFNIDSNVVFPTEHMRRAIVAAREGKTILEFPVYDGSETGRRVYNTLTVIGQPIAPDQRKPDDVAATNDVLSKMTRWPIKISYFDKSATGDPAPIYSIGFEMYENGISRALSLDYPEFVISGALTVLEIREARACP
jgi:EipB-like